MKQRRYYIEFRTTDEWQRQEADGNTAIAKLYETTFDALQGAKTLLDDGYDVHICATPDTRVLSNHGKRLRYHAIINGYGV
jgi:hypothetical protein